MLLSPNEAEIQKFYSAFEKKIISPTNEKRKPFLDLPLETFTANAPGYVWKHLCTDKLNKNLKPRCVPNFTMKVVGEKSQQVSLGRKKER